MSLAFWLALLQGGAAFVAPAPQKGLLELWLDQRGPDQRGSNVKASEWPAADVVLTTGSEAPLSTLRSVSLSGGKLLDRNGGGVIGVAVDVEDGKSQQRALSLIGSVECLLVSTSGNWTMIPCENLVAAAMGTPTKIVMEVTTAAQVQGAAFALELGVDGLLLAPKQDLFAEAIRCRNQRAALAESPAQPDSTSAQRGTAAADEGEGAGAAGGAESDSVSKISLRKGIVTDVREGGVGDRVCLDLVSLLCEGEGLLVGSSAKLLCLVHAETFETDFVPSRPFRVNAGPVHSYVLLASEPPSTKYLCEVAAGDKVVVVNSRGEKRPVTVGRVKVERRPLLMVTFQVAGSNGRCGQIFLQQAETVRLVSPDAEGGGWQPLSVTDAAPGDAILLRCTEQGTHVGRAISAVVTEY